MGACARSSAVPTTHASLGPYAGLLTAAARPVGPPAEPENTFVWKGRVSIWEVWGWESLTW